MARFSPGSQAHYPSTYGDDGLTCPSFALRRNNGILTYPTAAAALAVSTESSQEAIDHLDGTENHLDRSDDQQNGEEGEIPGDHIMGLFTLAP